MPDEHAPDTPQNAPQEPPQDTPGDPEPQSTAGDEETEALSAAVEAVSQVQGVADSASPKPGHKDSADAATPFNAPEFGLGSASASKQGIDLLSDVHMNVRIELGRTKMYVEDVLKLTDGAVVELDKLAGDPVDVFVNDRKVARGEVLVLNDLFCVRISEVVDITVSED